MRLPGALVFINVASQMIDIDIYLTSVVTTMKSGDFFPLEKLVIRILNQCYPPWSKGAVLLLPVCLRIKGDGI